MDAIIIGAGIGGLAAALALQRAGLSPRIFERYDQVENVGAGIQLSPNAVKVLNALGLQQQLENIGFEPANVEIRDFRTGEIKSSRTLSDCRSRYGAPYYQVHRADLHKTLLDAVVDTDVDAVQFNRPVVDVFASKTHGAITLESGQRIRARLIIGADGVRSLTSRSIFGDTEPTFTGYFAYRATIDRKDLPADTAQTGTVSWAGPNKHFVHYPVRGGSMLNCVALCETSNWLSESWFELGDVSQLKQEFKGWHSSLLDVIDAINVCYKWGLFDREPLKVLSHNNVTLLGDAAHTIVPTLAQGAAMAIEDAYVLVRCLQKTGEPVKALRSYQEIRMERTTAVQRGAIARLMGYHQKNEASISQRDKLLRERDWLYGYDPIVELGYIESRNVPIILEENKWDGNK